VRLVVVEGEAGIGKTRLLDEALAPARAEHRSPASGRIVLQGAADRDRIRPLGAFADALSDAVAGWPSIPDPLRGHRDAFGALFGGAPARTAQHPGVNAVQLHEGLLATLRHVLGGRSGVLVLDDLHWGDDDSIAALDRVLRSAVDCTLIVATRDSEAMPNTLVEVIQDAARRTPIERIELGPLSVGDVQQLLRQARGAIAASLAGDVHERTGGHPLLLVQLLDTGQLDGQRLISELPTSADESIRRRIVQLDEPARKIVNTAAVAGPSVTYDTISGLVDLTDAQVTRALRRLCDDHLLFEAQPDVFTFVHGLTRQVVEATMLTRERRALHRRVLDRLPPDAEPAAVVHHAEAAGDHDRMRQAARRAAGVAFARGEVVRAMRMASIGLAGDPGDLDLHVILAKSAWQLRHRPEARQAAERAIELAVATHASTAGLHWLLARLAWEERARDRFTAHLSALTAQLDGAPASELPELLTVIAELKMLAADDDEVAWGERAVAAAEGTRFSMRARINLGSSLTNEPGRRAEGHAMMRLAIADCDPSSHAFDLARAINNLLCDALYADPPGAMLELIGRFENHVHAFGWVPQFAENIALFRALCAERLGDRAAADTAIAWFGPAEPEETGCLLVQAAVLELDAGRPGPATRRLAQVQQERPDRIDAGKQVWCDSIALEIQLAAQGAITEQHVEAFFEPTIAPSRYMLDAIDVRGRVAVRIARADCTAAATIAERWKSWAGGDPDAAGVTAHLEAIALEQSGDPAAAIDRYRAAIDGPPLRSVVVIADALRGLARCHAALGDRPAARGCATRAVELLGGWPGPGRDESIRLLRQLGGRPPQPSASDLSAREIEVAMLISRGRTNNQIGAELGISSRTVGVHVRHILDKLGAVKRSEIAAHVVRQELAG
jgi:DNA-binding CsgD family transcriptional regulator/tetratricopeptide (TPR) repeat protein